MNRALLIVLIITFSIPVIADATTLSLHASPEEVGKGDLVRVTVVLDSALPVNAFSGELLYSGAMLAPVSVSDGNSIINMWLTHPDIPAAGKPISFAGITPGGYSGNGGILFAAVFRAVAPGKATLSLSHLQVLRNDGSGTSEPVAQKSVTLSVVAISSGGYQEPIDKTPPEPFTPSIGRGGDVFGGQPYLAFSAVDKGSGIDHYAVAESRLPAFLSLFFPLAWHTASSPYLIMDTSLTRMIYVKAVDRSGNERISVFPPERLFTATEGLVFLGILILVALLWKAVLGARERRRS